jgi:hypothetical protein
VFIVLQVWDITKKSERAWKVRESPSRLTCSSSAAVCPHLTRALPQVYVQRVDPDGVSSMEPRLYARRFMSMVHNTFVE